METIISNFKELSPRAVSKGFCDVVIGCARTDKKSKLSTAKISASIKLISTEFKVAFSFAIFKASEEISIAEIVAFGRCFFNEIGIQPVPVPMSNIEIDSSTGLALTSKDFITFLLSNFVTSLIIQSTNSSVSGLGIKVFLSTKNGKP